ncbi:MAG: hypothetical protein ACLFMQ_05105, partial [Desulfohalobiaceae bacterium]
TDPYNLSCMGLLAFIIMSLILVSGLAFSKPEKQKTPRSLYAAARKSPAKSPSQGTKPLSPAARL